MRVSITSSGSVYYFCEDVFFFWTKVSWHGNPKSISSICPLPLSASLHTIVSSLQILTFCVLAEETSFKCQFAVWVLIIHLAPIHKVHRSAQVVQRLSQCEALASPSKGDTCKAKVLLVVWPVSLSDQLLKSGFI